MAIRFAFELLVNSEINAYISYKSEFCILCLWICDFRRVLTVVFTICSSWIHILSRAYWWGPIQAETLPRLLGFKLGAISWKIEFHWSVRASQLRILHHLCGPASRSAYLFHALRTTRLDLIWSDIMVGSIDFIWPIRHMGYECLICAMQALIVGRAITTSTWMHL